MILLSLVHNLALLVALSLIHGLMLGGNRARTRRMQALSGLLFGIVAILGMLTPMRWAPGVIFDGRSIVLTAAGLFGGPLAGSLAGVLAGAYRMHLGGAGALMGVAVILEAVLLGIGAHFLRRRYSSVVNLVPLLSLGVAVHLLMLALMTLLPGGLTGNAFREVALPVILLYPLAFMLLGRLFVELEDHFLMAKALQASEARNQAILGALPDLMFLFSAEGRILDFQGGHQEQLLMPPEAFLGRTVEETMPPELAARTRDMIRQFQATGTTQFYEYTLKLPETRYFESRLTACGQDFLAIVRDVTLRRNAQQALRNTHALYEDLVANSLVGIYRMRETAPGTLDSYGNSSCAFEFISDRYCELTGLLRESLLEEPTLLEAHLSPEDLARWRNCNQEAVRQGGLFLWEGRVEVKGAERWLHFASRCRQVEDGSRIWTGAVMDVSDRVKAEAERQELERRVLHVQKLESLGVLAGGMAHDFNNILMAILGHADLAQSKLPELSPAQDNLEAIEGAARRAADLSRQMLAYSGRGKFVVSSFLLSDLVSEMVHLLQASISKKALLNLNLEKTLPPMEGDVTQIRQVLMNLITNASEAIGERSGVITISTGAMYCDGRYLTDSTLDTELKEGLYVFLEVSDTGCGMTRETQGRIFDPFFTTKFTGRGLGMAAVLGIIRGHRGSIRVYSELGKGTTFKLLFPAKNGATAGLPPEPAPHLPAWKGQGMVLVVDDEETLRALGQAMCQELGFEVLTAADGREAMDLYRRHADRIALVLLDLTMPHMNGEETFRELRQLNPAVQVLMSSGYTEQEVTARFAGKNLAGFIQKPYTLKELEAKLRGILEAGKA